MEQSRRSTRRFRSHLEAIFSDEGDGAVGPLRSPGWEGRVSPQGLSVTLIADYTFPGKGVVAIGRDRGPAR
ncbi:hypothetical protein ACFZBP_13260 [Streptomyces sp. NPDC008086]|uniref:hypothetical protein n=1 Tax=Streptomyces sp. NPDC008086 TaxID=3364807 RepID=UPI0036EA0F77